MRLTGHFLFNKTECRNEKDFPVLGVFISMAFFFSSLFFPVSVMCAVEDDPVISLSMQTAVLFALDENPRVEQSKEQKNQATFSADEARSVYYPQVSFSGEFGREYNDPGLYSPNVEDGRKESNVTSASQTNLSLRQMILDVPARQEVLRREQLASSAGLSVVLEEEDIVSKTIEAYLDVFRLQKNVENNQVFLESMTALTERLRVAFEAGAESRSKMKYAQARLALAQARHASSKTELAEAIKDLEKYTGPLPDFVASLPPELDLTQKDVDYYYTLALAQNTDIALNDSDRVAGERDIVKARGGYFPKVNLLVEGQQDTNYGELTQKQGRAVVQMQFDLFKGFAGKAATQRAESRVREIDYAKEEILDNIRTSLAQAFADIISSRETIDLKVSEAGSYEALRDVNLQALGKGDIEIFDVIENEERLQSANQELVRLKTDLYRRSYQLLRIIGALGKARFCQTC